MTLLQHKATLRERASDLREANTIERQAYRDALAGLDEEEQDRLMAMADRLAERLREKNPRQMFGETAALELLANIAPFVGGGNDPIRP